MEMLAGGGRRFRAGPVLVWVLISLAAGALGAVASAPGAWYQALDKPSWNPPAWIFGPVWTTLYVCMGVAAGLAWNGRRPDIDRRAFRLFGLQLALNALWSWLFFRWHRPDFALVDLAVLWLVILATAVAFSRIRPLAGWLLLPYLCWVAFAGALNASIAARNPQGAAPVAGVRAVGIAAADCAPWDGAATSIYLSADTDVVSLPPPDAYLHLIVYQSGDKLSGRRVDISHRDGNTGTGIAVRCQSAGDCASTSVGIIEFDRVEPGADLTGSYRLMFNDEPALGTFRASWIARSAICG